MQVRLKTGIYHRIRMRDLHQGWSVGDGIGVVAFAALWRFHGPARCRARYSQAESLCGAGGRAGLAGRGNSAVDIAALRQFHVGAVAAGPGVEGVRAFAAVVGPARLVRRWGWWRAVVDDARRGGVAATSADASSGGAGPGAPGEGAHGEADRVQPDVHAVGRQAADGGLLRAGELPGFPGAVGADQHEGPAFAEAGLRVPGRDERLPVVLRVVGGQTDPVRRAGRRLA